MNDADILAFRQMEHISLSDSIWNQRPMSATKNDTS